MDVESDAVAERSFHAMLLKIDSDLHQADLQALKFLIKDNLPKNKLTKMSTGHELFTALETSKLIDTSNRWLLVEMFNKIGRLDLIDYVDEEITEDLKSTYLPTGKISDYRLMLFDTAQDLTGEDTNKLSFLLDKIPKAKRGKVSSGLDLVTLMEESKIISPVSVDRLRQNLVALTRQDLVRKLDQYTERRHQRGCVTAAEAPLGGVSGSDVVMTPTANPVADMCPPFGHTAHNAYLPREKEYYRGPGVKQLAGEERRNQYVTTGEATEISQAGADKNLNSINLHEKQSTIPTYKMNANPRGICVIINNSQFWAEDEGAPALNPRTGSDIDADKLTETFSRLHFKIERYNDLPSNRMSELLWTIGGERVKAEHDCFVCCVLSHGNSTDKLYGSDCKLVEVNQLKAPFRPNCCPNLALKPKLFFLQACQGTEKQEGVQVQIDSAVEDDGPTVTVAKEADFLVGYATAPGYVSYRSKSKGSWYISKLTKMLDTHAHTEDLLSILTKVNNEVGTELGPHGQKQSPAPQFTLTKRLIFKKLDSTA
ncbi:caspase-8-like isoform X2 [Haliotis rufescens]|uniref:caspase-8-like isoform X2 n=1 Tax=Haliotis rufescens TaxID=6454 RepID=UPI001EAFD35F|nr:caspase-8-like isoform X2 [Haliotis rufescens]